MAVKATLQFAQRRAEVAYRPDTIERAPFLSFSWRSNRPVIFSRVLDDARNMQLSGQFSGLAWDDVQFRDGLSAEDRLEAHDMAEALNYIAAAADARDIKVSVQSDDFSFTVNPDIARDHGDVTASLAESV